MTNTTDKKQIVILIDGTHLRSHTERLWHPDGVGVTDGLQTSIFSFKHQTRLKNIRYLEARTGTIPKPNSRGLLDDLDATLFSEHKQADL